MKICVAGQGAFGQKHLDALKRIQGVEITSLVGGNQDATAQVAKKYGVPHYTGDLSEGIRSLKDTLPDCVGIFSTSSSNSSGSPSSSGLRRRG